MERRGALDEHINATNAAYRAKYGKDVFGNDAQLVYRQSWREADKVTTQAEKDTGAKARRLVVSGRIQDEIKAGKYITDVKIGQQNKHIPGTPEFVVEQNKGEHKSYFDGATLEDVKGFVKTNAGNGIIAIFRPSSDYPIEYAKLTGMVGKTWDSDTNQYVDTDWVAMQYSKKGIHAYPVFPKVNLI